MRKFCSTIFALAVIFSAFAQQITVKSVRLVDGRVLTNGFYPRFSEDGGLLFFTSENYKGLKAYDFTTQQVKVLSEDNGAGYGFFQKANSKTVFYKKTEIVDRRKKNSLYSYDLTTSKTLQLTKPVNAASLLKSVNSATKIGLGTLIYIDNQKIVIEKGGQKKVLSPNGAQYSYLWPVISPDGTKIAYAVAAKGTFVCDMNGKNVVSLGYLHAPRWVNNRWVVGMDDHDDGYVVTSSEIVAVSADGRIRQNLTNTSDKIEMYPAVSPAGDRIVFNTHGGELYMMNIVVE
jgi:Tol biopolymer transport system component